MSAALWERPAVSTLAAAAAKVDTLPVSMSNEGSVHALLTTAGATRPDLDAWVSVRGTSAPLWSLGTRVQWAAGVWPADMLLRDAIGWILISHQGALVTPAQVQEWDALTPHGWAYAAAGISLAEAATGTFISAQVRTMAALRGITVLPIPPLAGHHP